MLEETLGSGAVSSVLDQNVQHDTMLIHRSPQIVQHTRDADEHLIEMPGVSPGCGRRRRSLLAKSEPNFRHQCRMLSWVTTMPRSARISSTSRRLRLNT